jgi:putative ABC transport system permease protein
MGSSFALQDLRRTAGFQFGYDADHQLTSWVWPGKSCVAGDSASRFWNDMAARMAAVPGVRYAALQMRGIPKQSTLTSDQPGTPIEIILGEGMQLGYDLVTPDYFRVFGYPIVAGRGFQAGDAAGAGAAIVNRRTAARLWPLTSPVGRLLKLGPAASDAPWVRVVGVVGPRATTAGDSTVDKTPDLTVVRPLPCKAMTAYVRTNGDPRSPAMALYHVVRAAVPAGGRVTPFESARAEFEEDLRVTRLVAFLFTAFGVFTLVLSAVGVYGVLNYAVGQRIREFAMRSALGAQAADLRGIVLKDALEMVLGGTALGATTALLIGGPGLAGMGEVGAITLVSAEAVVILASLAACVGPIRRAVRADPVELLRST